jgi:hypothetical protein
MEGTVRRVTDARRWLQPATLAAAVATLLVVGVPKLPTINPDDPAPRPSPVITVRALRFQTDGSPTAVRGQYRDATGIHDADTINGDVRVQGLTWAVLAVYGQDIGCGITVDGVTAAAEGSNAGDGAGLIDLCVYSKD